MKTVLAIGKDGEWLHRITDAATHAEGHVVLAASVYEAVSIVSLGPQRHCLVVLDAECCTDRTGPAVRALRARLRVPLVVVFCATSERIARALPVDALVAKCSIAESLSRYLPRHRVDGAS